MPILPSRRVARVLMRLSLAAQVNFEALPDGRPSGECLTEFATEIEAERAMQFDRRELGGRYVELMRQWARGEAPGQMSLAGGAIDAQTIQDAAAAAAERAAAIKASVSSSGRDRSRDRDRDRDRDRRRSRSRDRRDRDKDRDRDRRRSRSRDRDRRRSGSPPRERKKKKSSNWDKPPEVGADGGVNVAAISSNPAVTYKARRIYMGNLPQGMDPPVTDASLRNFFDQAMFQAGLSKKAECCSDVWISSERNFAFVEVHTIEVCPFPRGHWSRDSPWRPSLTVPVYLRKQTMP
jgi:hypothetical protein